MTIATLILVPTEMERRVLFPAGTAIPETAAVRLCGFGPVAAAARAAQLIAELRPTAMVLVGLAGTYDENLAPIGSAHEVARVAIDGIGADPGPGDSADTLTVRDMGLPMWRGEGTGVGEIWDELQCTASPGAAAALLTVCAASGSTAQAARRRARFAGVVLEDMEGFGVALAGVLAGLRIRIVRGISNRAGDRDQKNWDAFGALQAARALLRTVAGI